MHQASVIVDYLRINAKFTLQNLVADFLNGGGFLED